MGNPEGKSVEAEMNIIQEGTTPIPNSIQDINITPPEIPIETKDVDPILGGCQPEESKIKTEWVSVAEVGRLMYELKLLKDHHKDILYELNILQKAEQIIQGRKRRGNFRFGRDQWEEIRLLERAIKRKILLLLYKEKNASIRTDSAKKNIYDNIWSILNGNKTKLKKIKQKLDILEIKVKIRFVEKKGGISWFIDLEDIPQFDIDALKESRQESQEDLKVAVCCPVQKIKLDNGLENGAKPEEQQQVEVEKNLTVTNSMDNNLKITHDSMTNEPTNPALEANQQDLLNKPEEVKLMDTLKLSD